MKRVFLKNYRFVKTGWWFQTKTSPFHLERLLFYPPQSPISVVWTYYELNILIYAILSYIFLQIFPTFWLKLWNSLYCAWPAVMYIVNQLMFTTFTRALLMKNLISDSFIQILSMGKTYLQLLSLGHCQCQNLFFHLEIANHVILTCDFLYLGFAMWKFICSK